MCQLTQRNSHRKLKSGIYARSQRSQASIRLLYVKSKAIIIQQFRHLLRLPSLDASDLVSYLVLQTSYVSIKQYKAHKSMEAYNQFVSVWVNEVQGWSVHDKTVVTGKVSLCSSLAGSKQDIM